MAGTGDNLTSWEGDPWIAANPEAADKSTGGCKDS